MTQEPLPRKVLALTLVLVVLAVAAFGLFAAMIWTEEVLGRPFDPVLRGALSVILAVVMTGIAGKKLFVDAPRSRRPRWQRAYGIALVLFAGWLLVLAFRGA